MFYCIDDVSVEETVILEFRSVSVFYKYFFKTELRLCQANTNELSLFLNSLLVYFAACK